tara:strand:- start:2164 stop:2301 length:138 start_codon:yes stop_codon:yes gene_type:complete
MGKGSKRRPGKQNEYSEAWERIWGKKQKVIPKKYKYNSEEKVCQK